MYYPIQIPNILDPKFLNHVAYTETAIPDLAVFVICCWQMIPLTGEPHVLENTIITDGCIDVVVDFASKHIGFSGMSKSNFDFPLHLPSHFMGLRLMPGAFHQLTGRNPSDAMDTFLPFNEVFPCFDTEFFFSLSFEDAKDFLLQFMTDMTLNLRPNRYVTLFNELSSSPPTSVLDLCRILNLSPRQCQRNCRKHYGVSPKVVLTILRFQRALFLLTARNGNTHDAINDGHYYDQSHFINDFKLHIGITPIQLLQRYNSDRFFQYNDDGLM